MDNIMTENHSNDIAESETPVGKNISVSELAARRLGGNNQVPETTEEVVEDEEVAAPNESEETEVNTESSEEISEESSEESPEQEVETEESSEDVLSQIDLDEMSEEDLRELGKKLGSKAVERFGKLTAQRKAAEEELQKLRASMQAESNDPLKGSQEVKNNPYGNIDTIEGIQSKADEVNGIIEWAEDVLFNADGYGPDDVVTEVEGKDLTKADVRKSLLNARKSRDKFLPAQLKSLQTREQAKQLKGAFIEKAKEELSWLQGEDNDTRKQYEAMIGDPRFEELENALSPDISAQLPYIIAHAANSIYGRKPVPDNKQSARLNPPKQPTGAGAQAERKADPRAKKVKEYKSRFNQTGNKSDFITLRTLQLQNR
jgi:Small-conductance mechanosensitive channel